MSSRPSDEDLIELIHCALDELEVDDGEITLEDCPRPDTVCVSVDGEYFGIFDYKRLTFVD
jgi:hypothetical protein